METGDTELSSGQVTHLLSSTCPPQKNFSASSPAPAGGRRVREEQEPEKGLVGGAHGWLPFALMANTPSPQRWEHLQKGSLGVFEKGVGIEQ